MARRYKDTQVDLELLDEQFTIRNRENTLDFLQKNPFLVPVLSEAYEQIKQVFPEAELFLEFFSDPEAPQQSHLSIWISTELPPHEAIEKLHQVDQSWYETLPNRIIGKLSTNLVFR